MSCSISAWSIKVGARGPSSLPTKESAGVCFRLLGPGALLTSLTSAAGENLSLWEAIVALATTDFWMSGWLPVAGARLLFHVMRAQTFFNLMGVDRFAWCLEILDCRGQDQSGTGGYNQTDKTIEVGE